MHSKSSHVEMQKVRALQAAHQVAFKDVNRSLNELQNTILGTSRAFPMEDSSEVAQKLTESRNLLTMPSSSSLRCLPSLEAPNPQGIYTSYSQSRFARMKIGKCIGSASSVPELTRIGHTSRDTKLRQITGLDPCSR
eukprot:TRINITY_DN49406_c0_g1_i1.p1 TRINITY_DN49406_c0_g1~~TRINITY_DN49406_c0_g1_i1.p1  ORF type:complete len:137 (-),score=11.45 TRINITY_DN49406_c0_g1_i1:497-907(-)